MSGIAIYSIKQHPIKQNQVYRILPLDDLKEEQDHADSWLTKIADACLYLISLLFCKKTPATNNAQSSEIKHIFTLPANNQIEWQEGTHIPDRFIIKLPEGTQIPNRFSIKFQKETQILDPSDISIDSSCNSQLQCQQNYDLLSPSVGSSGEDPISLVSSEYDADYDDSETQTY